LIYIPLLPLPKKDYEKDTKTKNPNIHMGRTLTLNSQKGQRKQTGKSTYHKKYNTNIANNATD